VTSVLLDQGLPPALATMLRNHGWDAVHVLEIGMHAASDEEILAVAAAQSRVCVTLDRDFPQTLALTSANGPSVVLIRRQHLKSPALAEILNVVWQRHAVALAGGAVVVVRERSIAVRMLPLRRS
jgi:predicted nuclease of predicted toxin-antitoxin system